MGLLRKTSLLILGATVLASLAVAMAASNTVPTSKASDTSTTISPSSCTVSVTIPSLAVGKGYYYLIGSARTATVGSTWNISPSRNIRLRIYSGNPFSGDPNPDSVSPPAGSIASANGNNVTTLTATSSSVAGAEYAVYFYNNDSSSVTTTSATVTYSKLTCP